MVVEQVCRIGDVELCKLKSADVCRVRLIQQRGQLAKQHSGF